MANYTEKQEYKVDVIPPFWTLSIAKADIIFKDDAELTRTWTKYSLSPGSSVVSEPEVVQQIAGAVWTTDVITAYEASLPPEPEPEITTQPVPEPQPNEEESN